VQVIGSQIERQQDDNACLAYWLTNTVTLLHLLQRNIKPASGSSGNVKRVAAAAGRSIMGGLFGRQPGAGAQHRALGCWATVRPVQFPVCMACVKMK
jgi:myosin-5